MICNKCGENNLDNARFCRSCGTSLIQTEAPNNETTKNNFNFKKILGNKKIVMGTAGIVLAVAVLIIAVSVIGSLTKKELCMTTENYITSVYSKETEKTSIFFNDVLLASTINGKATKVSTSTNGETAAFISDDNVLYVVEKDNIQKIAEDILNAELSYNGKTMAYVDRDYVLYTIQLNNRKIEKVADDIVGISLLYDAWFKFSPDGNTLLYLSEEDDEAASYIKNGATKTKLEDFIGLYPSNDGKIIYGFGEGKNSDSSTDIILGVYDLKEGSYMKLSNSVEDVLYNNNHRELLFSVESKYYLSINGEERIKLGNYAYIRPILPRNASSSNSMGIIGVSPVNSFVGTLMCYYKDGKYGIGYIDKNYEMQEVIKNIGSTYQSVYLTNDYNTVYYLRNDSLYKATRESNFEPEKLVSDVTYYKVSADGKKVYYVNRDDELICRYKNEDKVIAEDVYESSLSITDRGTVYFMTDYSNYSGILYRCSDGKNKVRVADDVYFVYVYPEFVKYFVESDSYNEGIYDIYISSNDKDFSKVVNAGEVWDDWHIN